MEQTTCHTQTSFILTIILIAIFVSFVLYFDPINIVETNVQNYDTINTQTDHEVTEQWNVTKWLKYHGMNLSNCINVSHTRKYHRNLNNISFIYRVLFNGELLAPFIVKHFYDFVDEFILIENELTFSGKPNYVKFFDQIQRNYLYYSPFPSDYVSKIKHLLINKHENDQITGDERHSWKREAFTQDYHREYIINNYCNKNKTFILYAADFDEVLDIDLFNNDEKKQTLYNVLNCHGANKQTQEINELQPAANHVKQLLFYYNFHWFLFGWTKAMIFTDESFGCHSKQYISVDHERRWNFEGPVIKNGGYHCSYCMLAAQIATKFASFSHTSFDTEAWENVTRLANCIKNGKNCVHSNQKLKYWNQTLPYEWMQDFNQFIVYLQQNEFRELQIKKS